jgi:hypothetical protein
MQRQSRDDVTCESGAGVVNLGSAADPPKAQFSQAQPDAAKLTQTKACQAGQARQSHEDGFCGSEVGVVHPKGSG